MPWRPSSPRPLPPGYPAELTTVGDPIRKGRLELGLLQKKAAERIGASQTSILNGEQNDRSPHPRAWPGIIRFLSYDPRQRPTSIGERLRAHRAAFGLSRIEGANFMKVDPSTLLKWEVRSDEGQTRNSIDKVTEFIGQNSSTIDPARF